MENLPPSVGFDVITRSEMSGNLVKSPAPGGLIKNTATRGHMDMQMLVSL